jgi:hypothetical protein
MVNADKFKLISYLFIMETELNYCKHCNEWKPLTPEFFYHYDRGRGRVWIHRSICLKCENENNKARSKRTYTYKLKQKSPKQILDERLATAKANREKSVRTCVSCEIEYPLTPKNFYFDAKKNYFEPRCIPCRREVSNAWRRNKMTDHEWTDNVTLENPGEFTSEEQKKEVHDFLKLLGWIQTDGVWHKYKVKTKNGKWIKRS